MKKYFDIRHDDSPYAFIPYLGLNSLIEKGKNKKISPIFANYLAESGANPAAIQVLLGHESLDTTTRYVHASDLYAQKMQEKFHPLKD